MRIVALPAFISLALCGCQTTGGPHVIVPANATRQLDRFYSVAPDCSSLGRTSITVTEPPQHGKVSVIYRDQLPSFPATFKLSACNKTPVETTLVLYISDPGYLGDDSTSITATFPNGQTKNVTYPIDVHPPGEPAATQ